jgi:hypothetical protein
MQRRAAEEELLAIGSEFRRALISYSSATPAGQLSTPPTLQALLKDPRYPDTRRHLRKLYFDPLTGTQQWGTVMSIDGKGIVGIYSLSKATPIKIGNFETQYQSFTDQTSYADWVFTPVVQVVPQGTVSIGNGYSGTTSSNSTNNSSIPNVGNPGNTGNSNSSGSVTNATNGNAPSSGN